MKKVILLFFACFALSFVASAQTQGDSRLHVLGSYGLRYKYFGVGAGFEYFFVDNFAIMPSYTKIFPNVGKASNFSADLRYYVSVGTSQLYFMAGYSQSWENTNPDGAGTKRNYKGANVGVGAYIPMTEWVGLSTEFKAQSQYPREVGFRFGFAFPL
ncbi:hypothetical protein FHS59_001716 [Algoriphagus iocasae]|uniref:Outer membrane protein beta-barrel domain-containing protein n=1 Tax=Algoriphagus iocasae TaxID=1836499 RepID=A0A841MU13_9BACT|nr:hypothetical protein [Algoriphagus iocasae]MBB6326088.1 hypothetical protein [Algoriphagus iocasae]